ncbi:phosphatidylglycerol:prolipoprotein diacylglycerol transferase [Geoalkalibacter ferrihydriticus]|uniref:Phosphatidylglycerol--prolipoprotein diacylglyceryl transferase n=1 Tax=Geoalkalibacter ferrihydriticus TaxID=392333 RepID=A0A1G9PZA8_9BACT|nr:prolipoprotein diacylglyceryl transferase [Geoalkalibacter ferrihydriticus]SDM04138.1 phosphatidylglycerol:prolipoprotein diacylglycerol transferase [Geoalkalibacter ferrihydriticus]
MLNFPQIDPVIVEIGPLALRWYGMMYLLGFFVAYLLISHLSRLRGLPLKRDDISDLIFYAVVGVIVGGRLGYVIFYNPLHFLSHPLEIFAIWTGGMSFHGGLLGVVVAAVWFVHKKQLPLLLTGDILVMASAPGLGFGRLGNFINAELWGRTTDMPWGMIFPGAGPLPRHPSQLYQAVLEGLVLSVVLYILHRRQARAGVPLFTFVALYGLFRFIVEFFREPDAHLGLLWGGATMGQLLSLPMIAAGLIGIFWCRKKQV